MSGSAVKEARRDIRRAFGNEAVTTLSNLQDQLGKFKFDTEQELVKLRLLIGRYTDEDLAAPILGRLDVLTRGLSKLADAVQAQADRLVRLDGSLWARVKWLVTGR